MKVISHVPGHPKTLEKILGSQYFRYNEISKRKIIYLKALYSLKILLGEAGIL